MIFCICTRCPNTIQTLNTTTYKGKRKLKFRCLRSEDDTSSEKQLNLFRYDKFQVCRDDLLY